MSLIVLALLVICGDVAMKYIVINNLPANFRYELLDGHFFLSNVTNANLNLGVVSLNRIQGLIICTLMVLILLVVGIKRRDENHHYMSNVAMTLYISGLIASLFDILMSGGSTGVFGIMFIPGIQTLYVSLSMIAMSSGMIILTILRILEMKDINYYPMSDDEKVRMILNSKNASNLRIYLSAEFSEDSSDEFSH